MAGAAVRQRGLEGLNTVLNKQVNGGTQRSVVGLSGGIVYFGECTSKMRVRQIADVIECAHWFGS